MLRIEKVSIQGFKSFCDPTQLALDEEGITAVVGPNGCGKSNIADAISWVIGEQRVKALRGTKMEDVIFQGSRNRAPAAMAEVVLTMVIREAFEIHGQEEAAEEREQPAPAADEPLETVSPEPRRRSRKQVSLSFGEGDRVTVARRLYRSGESEYEMNGRLCRLRDIQDLFAGTGLGAAHYAIIEQERIGQVLSAKPLDRRGLIEEAAGVSKFKLRQHAAELKLEAAGQNLSRVVDIITEIERQQGSLKRQAARARRYQRLRHEMRSVMRTAYALEYRDTLKAVSEIEGKVEGVGAMESETLTRVLNLESEYAQAVSASRTAEGRLNECRQRLANAEVEAERARQQHSSLSAQLTALGERSAEFTRDQSAIADRSRLIEVEDTNLREELNEIERQIEVEGAALAAEESSYRYELDAESQAEKALEEARQKLLALSTDSERWRHLKRQFEDAVERNQRQLTGLAAERERTTAQMEVVNSERAALAEKLELAERTLGVRKNEIASLTEELEEHRSERDRRAAGVSSLSHELSAVDHRLASLQELDSRRAYFSEAVQTVMSRSRSQEPGPSGFHALGTLADFVKTDPAYEATIESCLRDELQYVLVPSFDDALNAINFLKMEGGGRATFMVVGLHGGDSSNMLISSEPNGDGLPEAGPSAVSELSTNGHGSGGERHDLPSLLSVLGLQPEFVDSFTRGMPALAEALIVDDALQAVEASIRGCNGNGQSKHQIYLARTGERVVAGRLVAGGVASQSGTGVLALKREIADLAGRSSILSAELAVQEDALREVSDEVVALESERAAMEEDLRVAEKQTAVEREQWQQLERDIQRTITHLHVIEQETTQINEEQTGNQSKLQQALAESERVDGERSSAEELVAHEQQRVGKLRQASSELFQNLSRRRADFAASIERRRGVQGAIRRLESEANELQMRLNRSRLEALEATERIASIEAALSQAADEMARLGDHRSVLDAGVQECSKGLADARQLQDALELNVRETRDRAMTLRDERAQLEVERARSSTMLEHLVQSCQQELSEDITKLASQIGADDSPEEGEEGSEPIFISSEGELDLTALKARLEELREKIEGLGPINMMALAELEQIDERWTFLTGQRSDIEQAIADTQAAVMEIRRRSREKFEVAFAAINANFAEMFRELFGGGRGEMRLIDESDVLESGIEIIAQPPGKRLQNVLLLSGGEKAMAALALLLAIFRFRPSPFCLLDEVDAPLDEVNVGRFADKVVEMSGHSQFVIITHSKRTMEAARSLYGVTMEDPGVSKLVAVRLTSSH